MTGSMDKEPLGKEILEKEILENDSSIRQKISTFEENINDYWSLINQEGVWLFLATLGCWSVVHQYYQYGAGVIVFVIFVNRLIFRINKTGTFNKQEVTIRELIEKSFKKDSDYYKARQFDLINVKKSLNTINSIKGAYLYIICALFFVASILNWVGYIK